MTVNAARSHPASTLQIAVVMSFVGGFLDAYSYMGWGGVFAGAQSGNIILMAIAVAQGSWRAAIRHLPSILAFGISVVLAESLKAPRLTYLRWRPDVGVLALEATILLVVGLVSPSMPATLATALMAFAAGLQLSYFGRLHTWSYNTTMTTGNLRNLLEALTSVAINRDRTAAKDQAIALSKTIAAFTVGAGIGGLGTYRYQGRAIWMAVLVLCVGICLLSPAPHSKSAASDSK